MFLTENSLPRDFRLVEWHYLRKPVDFGSLGREVYLGYRTTILHAHTVAITDLTLISVDRVSLEREREICSYNRYLLYNKVLIISELSNANIRVCS